MGIFGWSYPPGCNGPPECPDPPPESEAMYELLESAGVDQETIDKACEIVESLVARANEECPQCLQRMAEAEEKGNA